ncbi:MAG: hypothetical protein JWQ04_258 [Pedosphaera sp.]|nr:hypothetical protein [Pedosphaera sp.]
MEHPIIEFTAKSASVLIQVIAAQTVFCFPKVLFIMTQPREGNEVCAMMLPGGDPRCHERVGKAAGSFHESLQSPAASTLGLQPGSDRWKFSSHRSAPAANASRVI